MEKTYLGGVVMTKDIKKELFLYSATDYFSLKEHFEEMARKGWMLEDIGFLTAIYRKIEPKELVFSVELYPKTANEDDKKSFINLCEESGWTYIASSKDIQVFFSNKEDILIPIHTDKKLHKKILTKAIFSDILSRIIWPLLLVRWSRIISLNYRDLFTNTGLMMPIVLILLLTRTLFYIFGSLVWVYRAGISVKKDNKLPKTSYTMARLREGSMLVLFVIFSIAIIMDIIGIKILSIIILLSLVVFIFIRKSNLKLKKETKDSINKTAILLSIFVFIIYMVADTNSIPRNSRLKDGYIGFTSEDFNLTQPQTSVFKSKGSLLAPKVSIYREIHQTTSKEFMQLFNKYGLGYTIETTYAKALNKKIAKYIFDGMLNEELQLGKENISIKDKVDNIDEGYYIIYRGGSRDSILILRDNEVIFLIGELDFSDEDNLEIINNKLNNYWLEVY